MPQYWIAVDGNIDIITTTQENDDYVLDKLQGQSRWEWGYFEQIKQYNTEQTKDFIKAYMADDEELSSD